MDAKFLQPRESHDRQDAKVSQSANVCCTRRKEQYGRILTDDGRGLIDSLGNEHSSTRLLGFASDFKALRPTIGLCTQLLGFAPNYCALHPTAALCTRHPTTKLCTRLLGFAPNYSALHSTIGLLTRLLCLAPDYCSLHPTTGLSSDDWVFTQEFAGPLAKRRVRP